MNISDLFCADLAPAIMNHMRQCVVCRDGARKVLTQLPMLTMMLPGDTKETLLKLLTQLDKEAPIVQP